MADKPKHAAEYTSEQSKLVKQTCLYIATKLGDLMDELLIIGGLVPSLLIDQDELADGIEPHVGTMDLDIGLELAVITESHYQELAERLRAAGFVPDVNDAGKPTRQRWRLGKVTVDFLIPPLTDGDKPGKLFDIRTDLAAIVAPGLRCAFRDRRQVTVSGATILGEKATRDIWVADAGAYVVLKSLAFDGRGENKDAYDLYYVLRNYGAGVGDVASHLRTLLDDPEARRAVEILKRDFATPDAVGPWRVAAFITGGADDDLQADVVGFVDALLTALGKRKPD